MTGLENGEINQLLTMHNLQEQLDNLIKNKGEFIAGPAISLCFWQLKNFTDEDWIQYEKLSKNKRPIIELNNDPIINLIDNATKFKDYKDELILKFLIYTIKEFSKAF